MADTELDIDPSQEAIDEAYSDGYSAGVNDEADGTAYHSKPVLEAEIVSKPGHDNPLCIKCGFFKNCVSPFVTGAYYQNGELVNGVPDYQPEGGWIVVVGDSPDENMDNEGGPAYGGREPLAVFKLAKKAGVVDRIFYIPSFLCLPRNDSMEMEKLGKPHLKRCFSHFIKPHIESLNPKAIVAMGPLGTFHMIGRLDYQNLTGRSYRWGQHDTPVYAAWHYEHCMLNPAKLKPELVSMLLEIFTMIDIQVVAKESDIESNYVLGITPDIIRKWFEPVKSDAGRRRVLCWDVESNGLEIWSASYRVGVFSFAHPLQPEPLIVITDYPIAESIYYRECPRAEVSWLENRKACEEEVRIVLTDEGIPKIGHNLQFDENSVYAHYGWKVLGFYADTFMMNWAMHPDDIGFAGLENLCRKYLPDVPEYWRPLDRWRDEHPEQDSYLDIPENILLPYAAYDTVVTAKLFKVLRAELKAHDDEGTHGGYFIVNHEQDVVRETYSVLQYVINVRSLHHKLCTHLERIGSAVDKDLTDRVYNHYTKNRGDLEAELIALPELQEFEENHLIKYVAKSSPQAKLLRKGEQINISWASGNQVKGFFLDFLKLPILARTEKKAPCLNEAVIQQYAYSVWHVATDGSKKLTERDAHALLPPYVCEPARKLLTWRKTEKFITSFLDPIREGRIIHHDGMIHCKYKSAHVATGRLSASKPPMQAIPRDGLVKKLYCSRYPEGWIITRDYSGLEVRVLALFSRCPVLLQTFRTGGDVHFNTQRHFFKDNADKKNKTQRSICKQALFGNIYGQGDQGLYDLLTENRVISPATGLPVTMEECHEFNQMIYEAYPAVERYVALTHRAGIKEHWISSAFGFTRRLPEMANYSHYRDLQKLPKDVRDKMANYRKLGGMIGQAKRRAQNTPIQSTASDLTVCSAVRIQQAYEEAGIEANVVNVIHDDIITDCRSWEYVEEAVKIKAWYMDNLPEWLPEFLPGYKADWIDCPILGECELGLSPMDAYPTIVEPNLKTGLGRLTLKVKDGDEYRDLEFHAHHQEIRELLTLKKNTLN